MFFLHGAQKFGLIGDGSLTQLTTMLGGSTLLANLVAGIELLGGLFILLGLWTRLSSVLSAIVMAVAFFGFHFTKGLNPLANGGELALLYLVAFLVLWDKGAGKWSLEKALTNKEYF